MVLTIAAGAVQAQTDVGGLILSDTTWDAEGSPYIVTSSILIGAGATLTIKSDVEVRVDPELSILVGGRVRAGRPGRPG